MTTTLIISLTIAATAIVVGVITYLLARPRGEAVGIDTNGLTGLETMVSRLEGSLAAQMQGLGSSMTDISRAFVNDGARGGWGELTLKRVLEQTGLTEGRDFVMQQIGGNGTKPDAVVLLPGDRKLVVDAKFPLTGLRKALQTDDPEERQRQLVTQADHIEKEAKNLKKRGYHDEAAGGFVVMYLPGEALFQAAMSARPELFERLLGLRVLIAGPASLMAILGAAAHVMVEHRTVVAAREIVDEARVLHQRLGVFVKHLTGIGSKLGGAVSSYNEAVGSYTGRLAPQAAKLADRAGVTPPASLEPIDKVVRPFEPPPGDDSPDLKATA